MRNSGKALSVIMQVLVVLFLWVASSEATVYTLNDRALNRNTSATVDDATAFTGLYSFKVDGTELMYQQWFWYRVGATGGEASLETLGAPTSVVSTATSVSLTYTKAGEFTVKVQYQLTPYESGLYRADLKKTVTITNISAQPLDYHLFEYSDYEITQLATQADKVEVVGTRIYQTGPQTYADEGITLVHEATPSPTSFDFDNNQIYLYAELKDDAPSDFPSPQTTYTTDAEADDLQFANQWDLAIPVGGSKTIDITDKVYPNLPLSATKTHAGTTVNYQGSADYTISYDNLKSLYGTTLTNVKIIDYLPKDTVFTSASTGGVHDPVTNTVTWSLANIAPLANTQSVQTSVTVNSVKDITNEALLVSDEAFPTRVTDLAVLSNHPPSIVSAAVTSAYTETPYTYQVKASDVDAGTTFSYSLASAPTGMTINSSTGVISWTPTLAQEGAHQVSVMVADNGSLKATQTYTVNVIKLNRPPVITSVAPAYAIAGQPYTYTIVASDPDGDALYYYLESSSLPQGLTLTGNVISWTPTATQLGTYNIAISVADAKLAKTYQYFSITVTAEGANTPPVVTKPADQTTIVGSAASLQIQATDADSNPLTYSATGLPAGLSINSATGLISGTLLSSIPGNYLVTVTVTDGFAPVAVSFTWVVKDKTTPVITWSTPAAITYGTALSATQLSATANTAGTFTYTPAAGTVLNAGTQTLNVTFTPNDTATYNTVTKSIAITVNKATAYLVLSGLNQTYTGTSKTVTATTSPVGLGYGVTYNGSATAPSAAGSYAVVATVTDANYTGSATGTLVIAKATPAITWATPTAVYVGTALSNTQLNATANVNGTFTYTPAVGTVMNTVGTQMLSASFAPTDSTNYNTATASVSLSVVAKQVPVITWSNPAAITYGTALSATQLSATANTAGTFTYTPAVGTVLNAGTQTLSVVFTPTDGNTYTTATKSVTLTVNKAAATVTLSGLTATYDGSAKAVTATTNPVGKSVAITYGGSATAPSAAGSYAVVATVTDPNYSGSATGTLVIAKATPAITWATPTAVYVGTALSNTQLNATANVNGTFTYTPAAGTVMNTAGAQTLSAAFTPADTANYNNASVTVSLSVVAKQVPVITWSNPAAITYGTALSATQLKATANTAGTFTYTPAAGTVLNAGTQTLSVVFTPTDGTTYTTATKSVSITVNPATATVSLSGLSVTYDGSAKAVTATTNPVGKSVAITYGGSATAPSAAGSYAVVATVTDPNYSGSATGTLVIAKATPAITWATPTAVYVGTALSSTQLNATANVNGTFAYTPAAGTVLNTAGTQTLAAVFTPADTANYNNASATVSLMVTDKQVPVITWSNPAAITYGTALSAMQLNAKADVAGTFTYSPALGTVLDAGTQTLNVTFTPNDTTTYTTATKSVTLTVNKAAATVTLSGLSAIYDGTAKAAAATTTPGGLAVTIAYTSGKAAVTAPTTAGSYGVTATINDPNYTGSATGTLVIAKATPVITWAAPSAVYVGTALGNTQLNATADVNGTFTYTPAAGTVMNTAGTQTLSASFAPTDGTNYNTATASVSLTVSAKQVPVITWSNPAAITYGTALSATQLDAKADVAGNFTYSPAVGTVLNAGTQNLSVTFTPTDTTTYATVTKTVTLTVNKSTPVITWATPTAVYVGTALSTTQLNATANVDGTFAYTPAAGTVLDIAGTQTLAAVFTPADSANYNNATASVSLSITDKQVPVITWSNPAAITYGTALSATQLNAKADVAGTFTYSPALGTVLDAGTQTLSVTFTPNDTATYTTATKTVSITVNPATVTVSLVGLTATYDGSAKAVTATTNPSGKTVAITYDGSATAPSTAGSYAVVATVTDSNYSGSATGTLVITKATPVITWAAPSAVYEGTALSSTQLNATANIDGTFAYTPASGTVLNVAGNQTLTAAFTPTDAANYETATASVSLTVTAVAKTTPVITWETPAAITYGTVLSAIQQNAKADVAGSFTYTPAAGTVLNAGQQTLNVTFTPADTTLYNSSTASVLLTVNKATSSVTLGGLSQIYSGTAKSATATTSPAGLAVGFTYNGSNAAPAAAGSYTVVATVNDANYTGSATGTMTIGKATPTIVWATPAPVAVGTALSSTQLNAAANVAGTFGYTPAAGTVMNVEGSQALSADFIPADTDNYNNATASVILTVVAANTNQAPVITSQAVTTAYKDGYYYYQVVASDPDGDAVTYSLTTRPSGMTINGTTGLIYWSPKDTGTYSVTVKVTDPSGLSASQSFRISVVSRPSNSAPKITSMAVTRATVGMLYNYDVEATDPNGDTVYYRLASAQSGMTIDAVTGLISWTPSSSQIGSKYVKVEAVDNKGGKTSQSFYITVSPSADADNPPAINSTPVIIAAVGSPYSYDVNATDADGDVITYSLTDSPAGMIINATTGVITWTPSADQAGTRNVVVNATAGGQTATQAFTIAVSGQAANQAPVITSQAMTTAYKDGYYYYQVLASDPDGDAVTYSLTNRPSGMTINGTTGLIYWHPQDTGTYSVTVKVTDPAGLSASQSFRISVVSRPSNSSPKITSTAVTRATVGVLYNYDVEATDPNGDAVYFRLASAQSGMTIDAISGLIIWTPSSSQTGSKYVKVEAFDSKGGKTSQSFYITVLSADGTINGSSGNSCDVNGDGSITADDIRMIVEGRGSNNLALDVNGDGEVTLLDSRACAIQMQ
ncbi:MBG domain-containing protein [Geobacter benzoatilyticus]|uniref:Ig domain-containing protein n=1 Tax=Geobacter benzoatilyticus TaxID=2815309 RepID=A0ABX7Q0F4_9BACT|nr:MBG domain-containing protein [Geobacter benzoatilyticus]QSV44630.1 putative Ig domain-containing protein [Geobacter benzoatilyticus]